MGWLKNIFGKKDEGSVASQELPEPAPGGVQRELADHARRALSIGAVAEVGNATARLNERAGEIEPVVLEQLLAGEHRGMGAHAAAIFLGHRAVTMEVDFGPELDPHIATAISKLSVHGLNSLAYRAAREAARGVPDERRAALARSAFRGADAAGKWLILEVGADEELAREAFQALFGRDYVARNYSRLGLPRLDSRWGYLGLEFWDDGADQLPDLVKILAQIGGDDVHRRVVGALEHKRKPVREAATEGLRYRQEHVEGLVLEVLSKGKKPGRLAAAELLAHWVRNSRIDSAIRKALETEKTDEVRAALQAIAPPPAEGVNHRTIEAATRALDGIWQAQVMETVKASFDQAAPTQWSTWAAENPVGFLIAVRASLLPYSVTANQKTSAWLKALDAAGSPLEGAWLTAMLLPKYWPMPNLDEAFEQMLHALESRWGNAALDAVMHVLGEGEFDRDRQTIAWVAKTFDRGAEALLSLVGSRDVSAIISRYPVDPQNVFALLEDGRQEVRAAAADLVATCGFEGGEGALRAALDRERAKTVRAALEKALAAFVTTRDTDESTPDDPESLDATLAQIALKPSRLDAAALPRLRWSNGAELSGDAFGTVLRKLEQQDHKEVDPHLTRAAQHLDRVSASELLDAIREQFDPESKERRIGWVLYATAILGGEAELLPLGRGLDDEARFGSFAQAERHLDVLARSGSTVAVQWLDHWGRKAKSAGLKSRARTALQHLAKIRGLTADEVAELAMNDFGFRADGTRECSMGDRALELVLGPANTILVRRDDGTLSDRIPKVSGADDDRKQLSTLKKSLKQATQGQVERLEQAMSGARSWSPERFESLFDNPIHFNLVRQTLWMTVAAEPRFFRVCDDRTFADVDDEPVDLGDSRVTVGHPVFLDARTLKRWEQVFVDYELVTPLRQFDRQTFRPTPEELSSTVLYRFAQTPLDPDRLRNVLERHGWQKAEVHDGGMIYDYNRSVGARSMTASLDPGVFVARGTDEPQRVTVTFDKPIGEFPLQTFSDVVWELTQSVDR